MENFKDGDVVQQFDGYGHAIYKNGKPVIRTCVSYDKYKADLETYGSLEYVIVDTCKDHPKKFKKIKSLVK